MIVYAVICRAKDAVVLAEHSTDDLMSGNAPQVTIALLQHLRDHPDMIKDKEMKTFVHSNDQEESDLDAFWSDFLHVCAMESEEVANDVIIMEYYFHLYLKDGIFYTCISDDPDTRDQKVNFAFLQQIQSEFTKSTRFRRVSAANAYAMDKTFAPNFRSSIHYYNTNHTQLLQDDKIKSLMTAVEDMKVVMGRNIQLSMQRAGNLEKMIRQSEEMEDRTQVFYKKAKVAKRRRIRKLYRVYATLGLMLLTLLYLIMAVACGWKLQCGPQQQQSGGGGDDP
ncbi:Vesicle-associated membrane protein 7 [Seminavis robusta]|uniref:Vesicle-associated membrane protein 7 n=1 Tax=Seminavis robusta TaxID=568900 RepID=A0A9N8HSD7_9STRA|nr:Vesicle-associated membrane protein 7 [Seminavis robusta]|eukprot:Sro1508_g278470.1 Vesicle-associated membrane protein 7 (280) ;mRNA; f:23356-24286